MPKKATPRTPARRATPKAPAATKKAAVGKKKSTAKAVASKTPARARRAKKPAPVATPVAAAAPMRLLPRRAIFIDVENSSNETELMRVLDHLEIDRAKYRVELTGVGNWKALGTRFARTLGRVGAQLLHTAPPAGVRDWSDLWIAVSIGRWIAHAEPGDLLDVVSDDRAFDAVADAASAAGVTFRRLSYRSLTAKGRDKDREKEKEAREQPQAEEQPRRPRRRRRRPSSAATVETPSAETSTTTEEEEAAAADAHHTATEEHIRETLRRIARETDGWINLDALANTLRAEGFVRPPGSLRLLTRLRRMGDVEVLPNGLLRLQP